MMRATWIPHEPAPTTATETGVLIMLRALKEASSD